MSTETKRSGHGLAVKNKLDGHKCPACNWSFNLRVPRMLLCGHAFYFCENCLGAKSAIRCMMCQKVSDVNKLYHPVPGGRKSSLPKLRKAKTKNEQCAAALSKITDNEETKNISRRSSGSSFESKVTDGSKRQSDWRKKLNLEIDNIKNNHQENIQTMKIVSEKEISTLKIKLDQLKRGSEKELSTYKLKLKNFKSSCEKELLSMQRDHVAQLEKIQKASEEKVALVENKVNLLDLSHRKNLTECSESHEKKVFMLKASHEEEVRTLTTFHQKNMEDRELHLEKLQTERTALQINVEELKGKITNCENDFEKVKLCQADVEKLNLDYQSEIASLKLQLKEQTELSKAAQLKWRKRSEELLEQIEFSSNELKSIKTEKQDLIKTIKNLEVQKISREADLVVCKEMITTLERDTEILSELKSQVRNLERKVKEKKDLEQKYEELQKVHSLLLVEKENMRVQIDEERHASILQVEQLQKSNVKIGSRYS